MGFPGGSEVKASASNAGDLGSICGSGRSPGEGNGNPLQCSCLGNPLDRGSWWATVHGIARSWAWLSDETTAAAIILAVGHSTTAKVTNRVTIPFTTETVLDQWQRRSLLRVVCVNLNGDDCVGVCSFTRNLWA